MTKGKIVLVPFPFDDLSSSKVRPAVCLTDVIGPLEHVVLAFITSQIPKEPLETDIVLDSDNESFSRTGLKVASTLRLHRLLTVRVGIIKRELGSLNDAMLKSVDVKLRILFKL